MNGLELFNNLIAELNKARDLIKDNELDDELVSDIDADIDRVFDHCELIDAALKGINIE